MATSEIGFIKLTPSRSEDFLACPRRFKRLHIDGFNGFERAPSKHLSFGITIHDTLRRFYEGGGFEAYPAQAMPRLLARSWVNEGYADENEAAAFRDEAINMLQAYHEAFREEPTRHLGHELFEQKRFRLDDLPVTLSGKIDRLSVWPEERLEVVDYKTNRGAPPSPEKLAGDFAPFLYYLLARFNHPDYQRIDVTFLFLRTMTKVTAQFDAETLAEGKARLANVLHQIDAGSFPPKPNGHCAWCEVRADCPAMSNDEIDLDSVVNVS